jgi:hypothetical protein
MLPTGILNLEFGIKCATYDCGGINVAWLTVLCVGAFFLFFWGLFWALVYTSNKNCNEEKHGWAKIYIVLAFADILGLIFVILDKAPTALAGLSRSQTIVLALLVLVGALAECIAEHSAELSLEQKTPDSVNS